MRPGLSKLALREIEQATRPESIGSSPCPYLDSSCIDPLSTTYPPHRSESGEVTSAIAIALVGAVLIACLMLALNS